MLMINSVHRSISSKLILAISFVFLLGRMLYGLSPTELTELRSARFPTLSFENYPENIVDSEYMSAQEAGNISNLIPVEIYRGAPSPNLSDNVRFLGQAIIEALGQENYENILAYPISNPRMPEGFFTARLVDRTNKSPNWNWIEVSPEASQFVLIGKASSPPVPEEFAFMSKYYDLIPENFDYFVAMKFQVKHFKDSENYCRLTFFMREDGSADNVSISATNSMDYAQAGKILGPGSEILKIPSREFVRPEPPPVENNVSWPLIAAIGFGALAVVVIIYRFVKH